MTARARKRTKVTNGPAPRRETREAGARDARASAENGARVQVRMYRQGLGDCFLITVPRAAGPPFHMMIDCGVILGTENPSEIMGKVVRDIVATTNGRVDVVVATHEHWDHISGFLQAKDAVRGA